MSILYYILFSITLYSVTYLLYTLLVAIRRINLLNDENINLKDKIQSINVSFSRLSNSNKLLYSSFKTSRELIIERDNTIEVLKRDLAAVNDKLTYESKQLVSSEDTIIEMGEVLANLRQELDNQKSALQIYKKLKHSYEIVIEMLDTIVYHTVDKPVTLSNIYYSTNTHYISGSQREILAKCVNYYNSHKNKKYTICDCCVVEPH